MIKQFIKDNLIRIIIGIVLLIAVWWVASSLTGGKRAQVEANLNSNIAGANLESGEDAVQTVGQVQSSAEAIDVIVRENGTAIDVAPGASTKIDPAAHNAGLVAYCKHKSARKDPRCATR